MGSFSMTLIPIRRALCAVVASAFALAAAAAQPHSFGGQTITLLIGSDVGAGFDAYGRLTARHLGRFLPGNPSVVPKNMPGAAGVRLANWLYAGAPQDGTTIALVQT